MRKINWLSLSCVAACMVQTLAAADNYATPPTSKEPSSSRSRLLIFSRNKTKVQQQDQESKPVSRVTKPTDHDEEVPVTNTLRSSGTPSPRPAQKPRAAVQRPAAPVKKVQSYSRSAPAPVVAKTAELEPAQDEDEIIRQLFENDEKALAAEEAASIRTTAGKSPAARPEVTELDAEKPTAPRTATPRATTRTTTPRAAAARSDASLDAEQSDLFDVEAPVADATGFEAEELETSPRTTTARSTTPRSTTPRETTPRAVTPKVTSPRASRDEEDAFLSEETEPQAAADKYSEAEAEAPELELPKVNRYNELVEAARQNSERTAPQAATPKKSPIQPVSRSSDETLEFEVNPFEPGEKPTKVVNAGFESENGKLSAKIVKPVSATTANKVVPVEKPTAKIAEKPAKPAVKATEKAAEPAAASKPAIVQKAPVTKPRVATVEAAAKPATPVVKAVAPVVTTVPVVAAREANNTPQVEVKWEARGEVTLGQECQCALIVSNKGKSACRDLVVEANFPESVRLVDSQPFPQPSTTKLEWHFANLAAGEIKTISLTIIPTKSGELAASAQVRFTGVAATSFKVSEPMLTTDVKVPAEVRLGDPTSATVTVSNPGTGTAKNVVVTASLPEGLDCKTGREFSSEIGPLAPGEARTVRISLIAVAGGDHELKVVAQATESGLEQVAQANVRVLAPNLTLSAVGPSLRYLNRTAKYSLTATNNSNAVSDNVRISQTVPSSFDFVKADQGGHWDSRGRTISWFVGQIQPGQSKSFELELVPKETGEFRQQFRITGDAGVEASTVVLTRVEGAASLVMEVKDSEDPIEVGGDMTYAIIVRNEGTKSAAKVAISCELPTDVEIVDVDGPTPHIVESGMLIFKPIPHIAAKDSVTYRVTVKGTAAGNLKLRSRLTSESIQKPLIVEEATEFYAE